jgi:hypothetical protein
VRCCPRRPSPTSTAAAGSISRRAACSAEDQSHRAALVVAGRVPR